MKQLIIAKNKAYATGVTYKDLTQVPEGTLAMFNLSDGSLISTKATLKSSFAVVLGRGANKMPLHFPEVNLNTLTVEKATYQAGKKFTASLTVPTTEEGKEYTIVLSKCGTVFNERNLWSFTALAKNSLAADVAASLVKSINANSATSGVTATNTGGKVTVTAVEVGPDYNLYGADELMGIAPTEVTHGVPAQLDKAYIQDLASRCAAGKGFNYLSEDGKEIYPGYPEAVDSDQYVLYTLRFAVPRVAAKQRDEVVYQLLHIAVPVGAGAITTLDAIFGDVMSTSTLAGKGDVKLEIK